MKTLKYFLLNIIHYTIFLHASSKIFRGKFVLGNKDINRWIAAIITGVLVVILIRIAYWGISKIKKFKLNWITKLLLFFAVNFVSLWIAARLAPCTGFGAIKFTWILLLSAIISLIYSWKFK